MFKFYRLLVSAAVMVLTALSFGASLPAYAATYSYAVTNNNCGPLGVGQQCVGTLTITDSDALQGLLGGTLDYVDKSKYDFSNGNVTIHVNGSNPSKGTLTQAGKTTAITIGSPGTFTSYFANGQPEDSATQQVKVAVKVDFGSANGDLKTGQVQVYLNTNPPNIGGDQNHAADPDQATLNAKVITYSTLYTPEGPGKYTLCIAAPFLTSVAGTTTKSVNGTTEYCENFTKVKGTVKSLVFSAKGDPSKLASSAATNGGSCDAGDFSWFICDVVFDGAGAINKIVQDVMVPNLKVDPLTTTSGIRPAWASVRDLADILFIIIFLVVIFGTTAGLDAYTIKKVLPRLVMAAIFVQFSYFISGLFVDLGNVLGAGIHDLVLAPVQAAAQNSNPPQALLDFTNTSAGSRALATGVIAVGAGIIVVAVAGAALAGFGLAAIAAAFIAVLMVFVTLFIRQALIVLLIVLSPLAFAAWVLPNTESYFKKWYRTLLKLIMMYPIIQLLFASGTLLAWVVSQSSTGFGDAAVKPFVELAALILPLFMIPGTFKNSGTILDKGTAMAGKLSSRGQKAVNESQFAQNRAEKRKANALAGMTEAKTGFGRSINRARAGFGFSPNIMANTAGNRKMFSEVKKAEAARQEAYSRQAENLTKDQLVDRVATTKDKNERKAFISHMANKGMTDELATAREGFIKGGGTTAEWQNSLGDNYGKLAEKAPHAIVGVPEAAQTITAAQLQSSSRPTKHTLVEHTFGVDVDRTANTATVNTSKTVDQKSVDQLVANLGQVKLSPTAKATWDAAAGQAIYDASAKRAATGTAQDVANHVALQAHLDASGTLK